MLAAELKQKFESNPKFAENLAKKLEEKGTVDETLNAIVEAASECGLTLTKEELKKAMQAKPDTTDLGGSFIVYDNYFIIS